MKGKILLVDDEKNFGAVLKDYLQLNDYQVVLCEDGEKGWEAFKAHSFDMCILDVMMPRKDGFVLASEIRQLNAEVPLLFLTAKSLKEDIVKGYRAGADDYIVKPFDTEVLLLKLNAMLSRKKNADVAEHTRHTIGTMEFNYKLRIIIYPDKRQVKLSPKEAELLQLLCRYKGDVLQRSVALKQIWKDDNYFTGRSMDVFIVKLRKYLQEDPSVEITSLHGNGYSLLEKK